MREGLAKTEDGVGTGRAGPPASRPRGRAILTSAPLNGRDVRRKRPPALSFLLRMETLRRVSRVASMLAVDYAAVYLAIFTRAVPQVHHARGA